MYVNDRELEAHKDQQMNLFHHVRALGVS